MGGENPYLKRKENPALPKKSYTVTFMPMNQTITVNPAQLPLQETGLPGSILDIAMGNGIDIDHACGGVCACSTCHVIVKKGLSSCNEAIDEELDQLDNAPKTTFQSRLACQVVPDGSENIEILIPSWNRNLAREGH